MKEKRIELYQKRGEFIRSKNKNKYPEFLKNNPSFDIWEKNNFGNLDLAIQRLTSYNTEGMFDTKMSIKEFISTYACDLDWAKQTEYCKVAPEAPKTGLFPVTEDERTKIIGEKFSEYPCIHDLTLYLNRKADGTVSYFLYFEIGDYKAFYYPKGRVVEVVGDKKEVKKYQCPTSNETSKTPTSYDDDVSSFLGSKTS
jgi:hypothetical protein